MQHFFRNRLWQPVNYGNDILQQLNMVFCRLNILPRVARMRITASLSLGQKIISGQLKHLASYSKVFDVAFGCRKEVRITALTEKQLHSQIAGIVSNVYAVTVWCVQLPVAENACHKESCVVHCGF